MATLALDQVTKAFGAQTVLDDVSLAAADGETIVVFGPSGAGKTVLLRLVAGMHEPDRGAVLIDGEDMRGVDPDHRGVGMAFQNFALFPHMSAYRNIATPLEARRARPDAIRSGVERIADLLKIGHVLDHMPRELSNGQKQRTALARALVAGPRILLLDDPLRNVDAKLRFEMRLELPRLLRGFGSTVLYVTQDYREAMALADRIAVLIGGHVVQVDAPETVYARPATIAVARLFGDPTINLLDVSLAERGGEVEAMLGGSMIRLADGHAGLKRQQAVLGIRPEAIGFCDATAADAMPVAVSAVTPLNERVVTLATTPQGLEILVSRPSGEPGPAPDSAAHVRFDPDEILLFDRESGRRLSPAMQ